MATIFCLNQPFLQAVIHVSWTSVAAKVYPSCIFRINKGFTNSSLYIIFFKLYLQGDYWYEFNTRWREWLSFHKFCLFYAMDISGFIGWVYNWNFQVFNLVCIWTSVSRSLTNSCKNIKTEWSSRKVRLFYFEFVCIFFSIEYFLRNYIMYKFK